MKFQYKKIKQDTLVLLITIFSLLWIFIYSIVFLSYNELFKYAYEFGVIFYSILSSVVASGIFYFIVVYLDKKRKEKIINKIIQKRLKSISTSLFIIKKDVFPIFGLNYNDPIPKFDIFFQICKSLNLNEKAPLIPNTITEPIIWYDYFNYFFNSNKYNSQFLYAHIALLDIKLIDLLDEIQFTDFQRALESLRQNNLTHDISGAPGPFWVYLKSLEAISKYLEYLEK